MAVRARSRFSMVLVMGCVVSMAQAARAEVPATATARELALQGIDLVEHGDCARGQPLLEAAENLHHATVHLQYLARCKARDGHLVSATELWRRIIREGAPAGSSAAVESAVLEATTELPKNLPRLASTTFRSEKAYANLELTLDGTPLPAVVIGNKQILDPGEHELVAKAPGFLPWTRKWTLAEGGSATLDIVLTQGTESPAARPPGSAATVPTRDTRAGGASTLSTAGWVVTSTGGVALIAGVVTWLSRNSRRSQLESDCRNGCPQPPDGKYTASLLADKKQTIVDLTTATNILMFGGGALVAGGVTMIVLGSSKATSPGTGLTPAVGPGVAGLYVNGRW